MKTDFLNLNMKNPLIVAAGPWNKDGHSIRKAIEAGAGAVITESIVSDAIMDVSPRIAYDGKGAQNIRLYSDIQVEGWEREMQIAKSGGGIVIASVSAHTPSEVAYLAAKMERFGADAIEISISNPMGESLEVAASHADVVFEITKEVVSTVKIPVMVKLSQTATNITAVAKAAKEAGAAAISAINTIRCILGVDIENARPMLPTYGGYSGAPIRPIGLAAVASIAQAVDVPVCGIGGIENYRNVLEYIMLGASAVQIGTAVMINGPEKIREISRELEMWAEEKNISDVEQIRGLALEKMKSFDEMKAEPVICNIDDIPCETECRRCEAACMYGAITRNAGGVEVNDRYCTGCGLCTFICPDKNVLVCYAFGCYLFKIAACFLSEKTFF